MSFLTVPPVVPDAVYRICCVSRNPNLYFEWQTNSEVRPAALKADSDAQKWKILSLLQTGTYTITNVASNANLSVSEYTEDNTTKYRLYSGGSQAWTLGPRLDQFVIGVAEDEKCVDLADNDWLIVWPRYNGQNQRFSLQPVQPTGIAPGPWCIKNRATNGQLCVWTGFEAYSAPTRVWPTDATTKGEIARIIPEKNGGYTLMNTYSVGNLPRWLLDSGGPVVALSDNVCRIIPVPGTDFYFIAASMAPNARVLMDTNKSGVSDGLVSAVAFDRDDQRQHWQFFAPK